MAPGLQLMVDVALRHFKPSYIILSDNELLEVYKQALIKDKTWNEIPWEGYTSKVLGMIVKALRLACQKAFFDHKKLSDLGERMKDAIYNHNQGKSKDGMYQGNNMVISNDDLRKSLRWGTYGIDGKQPLQWVRLIDCSSDHLRAILCTQPISMLYRNVIEGILEDRSH